MSSRRTGQPSRGRRTGRVFSLRLSESELERLCEGKPEHVPVGTWIRNLGTTRSSTGEAGSLGSTGPGAARAGNTRAREHVSGSTDAGACQPGSFCRCGADWLITYGTHRYCSSCGKQADPPPVILDLCSGTGAWSDPYVQAGYDVRRITLPAIDVRFYAPPNAVHGVLAAPPCEAFSLARNGNPPSQDELTCGLGVVVACLRVIALARPSWWALENPVGRLAHCLGRPRYTFEPWWFGDPWTKSTSLWGTFRLPPVTPDSSGFVRPTYSAADRTTRVERARTPPGFARAFFQANP